MLQYHIGFRITRFDIVIITVEVVHTTLVVSSPCTHIAGLTLGEPFRQIKTKSVDLIFFDPVFQRSVHEILCGRRFMVEVLKHIEGMSGYGIEPGAVGGGTVIHGIPVQFALGSHEGVELVVHNIQNHGDAVPVQGVDQFLQFVLGTIGFVGREIERGIIAPALISAELLQGHELDSVDAQPLEIVKGINDGLEVPCRAEITHQQLIDDEVLRIGARKIVHPPVIGGSADLQHAHITVLTGRHVGVGRIWFEGRIVRCRNEIVVEGIQNLFGIGIGDVDVVVHHIVVRVFRTRGESLDGYPEIRAVGRHVHQVIALERPVAARKIAQQHAAVLFRCIKHQRHRVGAIVIIDAFLHTSRQGFFLGNGWYEKPQGIGYRGSTQSHTGHKFLVAGCTHCSIPDNAVGAVQRSGHRNSVEPKVQVSIVGGSNGLGIHNGADVGGDGLHKRHKAWLQKRTGEADAAEAGRKNRYIHVAAVTVGLLLHRAGIGIHIAEQDGYFLDGFAGRHAVKRADIIYSELISVIAQ